MAGIVSSLTESQQIELLFIGYFGRAAAPGGYDFWEGAYNSEINGGASSASVVVNLADSFATQAETIALYPFLNPANNFTPGAGAVSDPVLIQEVNGFVNSVFENLFDHAATIPTTGLNFWTNQILSGGVTVGEAILSIADGALGDDAILVQNKVACMLEATTTLAADGIDLSGGPTAPLLAELHSIQSLVTTDLTTSLTAVDDAITAFVNSGQGLPGPTVILTTGADAVDLQGSNNTIVGTFGENFVGTVQPTFSNGDVISITGGGVNNVINLTDNNTTGFFFHGPGTGQDTVTGVNATVSGVQIANISGQDSLVVNTTGSEGWTGLQQLNVTSQSGGGFADQVTAAATTAIVINDIVLNGEFSNAGSMLITGGSTVVITENNGVLTGDGIYVNGGSGTTGVSVKQTQSQLVVGDDQYVQITDGNWKAATAVGTIATVSLDGLDNGAWIGSSALTNLTVNDNSNFWGDPVVINNGGFTSGATTLSLSLNNDSAFVLEDSSAQSAYTTLAITTGALASTVTLDDFGNVTSETISGATVLTQSDVGMNSLATITVSGAAGLTDSDLYLIPTLTSVTSTSSGAITVALNDTLTTFTGSTGTDIVTIFSDATQAITAGSATNNEIILDNAAGAFSAADTGVNVTGFEILGTNSLSSGDYVLSGAGAILSGITAIDVQTGSAAAMSFTGVKEGTTLAILSQVGDDNFNLTYSTSDSSGPTDSVAITYGSATSTVAQNLNGTLTLDDSIGQGIGTVTIAMQGAEPAHAAPFVDSVTQLTDFNLSSLTVSGPVGLYVGTLADNAASLTITDSDSGNVTINDLTAPNLTTETFTNTGSGTLSVSGGAATDTGVVVLNLNGNVSDFHGPATGQDTVTSGITVAGATDNALVHFETAAGGGAVATKTDTFTLGNGDDTIVDNGAGTITVKLGTGGDSVSTPTAAAAGSLSSITLGVHTSTPGHSDAVTLGASAFTGDDATGFTTVSGLVSHASGNDTITFAGDAGANSLTVFSDAAIVTWANGLSLNTGVLSTWVDYAVSVTGGALAQHEVGMFTFAGNTYLLEQANAANTTAGDTIVELVGAVAITSHSTVAAGTLHLLG